MIDEEIVVFPYIVRMEQSDNFENSSEPSAFESLGEPVATMVFEHDDAGDKLRATAKPVVDSALQRMPAPRIVLPTELWESLRRICTSIFTWRTTFFFHGYCARTEAVQNTVRGGRKFPPLAPRLFPT
jgi:hypothetical protein